MSDQGVDNFKERIAETHTDAQTYKHHRQEGEFGSWGRIHGVQAYDCRTKVLEVNGLAVLHIRAGLGMVDQGRHALGAK